MSGNKCAFPDCDHPLFNSNNLFVAQLCHIEAISPEGPRYNPETTEIAVNSFENLLFLCYRHHKETDDVKRFDVTMLKRIKAEHEARFKESAFGLNERDLETFAAQMNDYWNSIESINSKEHNAPDLKITIEVNADEQQLIEDVWKRIEDLDSISNILRDELKREYFELVCLALPNSISRLSVLVQQLEIQVLEQKIKSEPRNDILRDKLERLKELFMSAAKHAGFAD